MKRSQFGIKSILILMFFVSFIVAIFSQSGSLAQRILVAVLLANFLGVIVAIVVTFVLKFPRDGTYRIAPQEHPGSGKPQSGSTDPPDPPVSQ